jgi:hypothetical protein
MAKRLTDVRLRIRVPPAARISHLARVEPDIEVLTERGTAVGGAVEFPLGAWGSEERVYDLRVELDQEGIRIGNDIRVKAAGVEVVLAHSEGTGTVAAKGSVFVQWTTDEALTDSSNEVATGYAGQQELATVVKRANRAWERSDPDAAALLGRAVALAHQLERDDVLEQLRYIAEFEDPAAGRVRLRPRSDVRPSDRYGLEWMSSQSRPVRKPSGDHGR